MKLSDREKYIIERYAEDEETMVLLFAQWCVNNEIDAHELYEKAYPHQPKNKTLEAALQRTVLKGESELIPKHLVVAVLQAFGNDDLAFEIEQIRTKDE